MSDDNSLLLTLGLNFTWQFALLVDNKTIRGEAVNEIRGEKC